MKQLFNDLIHGKLALAFFLTFAFPATACIPLIGASFVEPALLSSPPAMASLIVITDAISTAARAVFGGSVTIARAVHFDICYSSPRLGVT